jgi:hypothetical protein
MGSFLRAFLPEPFPFSPRDIIDWGARLGCPLVLEPDSPETDLDSRDWESLILLHQPSETPVPIDICRGEDAAEEIGEFVEMIKPLWLRWGKRAVLDHLSRSRAVCGVQVLASGSHWEHATLAAQVVMQLCSQRHGALIQADGEGFYRGTRLILRPA